MTITSVEAFSAQLRSRTARAHAEAEETPFFSALAFGRVTREGVVGLLQRLVPVYDALEELAVRWSADADVAPLLVPGLERATTLRDDLAALGAPAATTSTAAHAYAQRIRAAATDSAPAFVAHHYTRYLGDLSGGQIIARGLRDAHGLELAFLSFPALKGPAVKRAYREHLDALAWTPEQQEDAVTEAGLAFAHNRALAAELEGEIVA